MKLSKVLIFSIYAFLPLSCMAQRRVANQDSFKKLKSIQYTFSFESSSLPGKQGRFDSEIYIHYMDDKEIYEFPIYDAITRNSNDNPANQNQDFELTDKVDNYGYLLRKNGSSSGRYFDKDNAGGREINADSMLQNYISYKEQMFHNERLVLVISEKHVNGFDLVETYKPSFKPDPTYNDEIKLFYRADYNDISFSFSPYLDKNRKMKLVRAELKAFAYTDTTSQKQIPERKTSFEIRTIKSRREKRLIEYFHKFDEIAPMQ